jgi:universal stress protein E
VMGTISRGGIPGVLVGNTAERLLPRLDCSLLTVKPEDFVCPVEPAALDS